MQRPIYVTNAVTSRFMEPRRKRCFQLQDRLWNDGEIFLHWKGHRVGFEKCYMFLWGFLVPPSTTISYHLKKKGVYPMTTLSTRQQWKAALPSPVPLSTKTLEDGQWVTSFTFMFPNLNGEKCHIFTSVICCRRWPWTSSMTTQCRLKSIGLGTGKPLSCKAFM